MIECKDSHPALFISLNADRITVHDQISARTVQAIFGQHNKDKGYKETDREYAHVHKLRHTFITRMVRSGSDTVTIKTITGHASSDMIDRYSLPTEEECTAAIEKAML